MFMKEKELIGTFDRKLQRMKAHPGYGCQEHSNKLFY